ncbi:hypothetical protein QTH90_21905 [Variovorax sp. J2P1-59]|uniref:hypothetical protein n=1 Tax=Variovorax flavidus TaxID=3053501 RepID=UPI0025787354|nr:hypothetical protein [Variovorax sp. J2P1-59]MDM0077079.1 hypothetical protein [Variovorax sp. J2P1-59]
MVKHTLFVAVSVALAGCASRIETVRIDPTTLKVAGPGVEGVVYYEPMLVKVRYEFTQLLDKDKGLIGSSDEGTCRRVVQKEEVVTLPDYQNARAILHKPSWFSATEFGATLNNGMLVSVTSKSTPQTAPILEQLVAAKTAGILVAPSVAGCNAGPIVASKERVTF